MKKKLIKLLKKFFKKCILPILNLLALRHQWHDTTRR